MLRWVPDVKSKWKMTKKFKMEDEKKIQDATTTTTKQLNSKVVAQFWAT